MKGRLYLIPSTIGDSEINSVLPPQVKDIVNSIRYYIVENERTARRFLLKLGIEIPVDALTFYVLNKHTDRTTIENYLTPCKDEHVGLLSEAGVPAVADPGSDIVSLAHIRGIRVVPLVGPSSVLLSLMASGLNGQGFTFHGYLPVKPDVRKKKIKELEQYSHRLNQTQIFIEAPYRNNQLFKDLLSVCHHTTFICVACNITQEDEFILTRPVSVWKKNIPDLHKKPTIFLLQQKN